MYEGLRDGHWIVTCQGLRALAVDLSPTHLEDASNDVARCEHVLNTLGEGVIVDTAAGRVSCSEGERGLRHLPLDPLAFPCRSASHFTPHLLTNPSPTYPHVFSLILTYADVCWRMLTYAVGS